ncbi:two-component sensor histidine kinase [Bacilli bacterium]|nr:two-component sensor histidine kinase [Bacilli bacterium]
MFLLQMASLYIFFQRYWDKALRKNVASLVRKIEIINGKYDDCVKNSCDKGVFIDNVNYSDDFKIKLLSENYPNQKNVFNLADHGLTFLFNPVKQFEIDLHKSISDQINFSRTSSSNLTINISKPDGVLGYEIGKNSILIPKVSLMIFWNAVSFLIIISITFIFIKNQVKSIKLLKDFVNDFSYLEKDNINFKPTGAKEIREVGWAFLNVVEKMKNLVNARTTMLAQISHDLKTPLTRIKLQAEFINDVEIAAFLKQDLEEMEKMINEYLLFARGKIEGNYSPVDIRQFFYNIIDDYKRSNYGNIFVNFDLNGWKTKVYLKVDSFKRCINNLINNSLRYRREEIIINIKLTNYSLTVSIEDDGKGIGKDLLKKIKRPFYRTNDNGDDGNFGLGLSVVQHVVDMHRGKLYFDASKTLGGLNVTMVIPLVKRPK